MKTNVEAVSAGFASLYPPYEWIPASAGMTQEAQAQGPVLTECRDKSLPGVWGCPPIPLVSPQDWGLGG